MRINGMGEEIGDDDRKGAAVVAGCGQRMTGGIGCSQHKGEDQMSDPAVVKALNEAAEWCEVVAAQKWVDAAVLIRSSGRQADLIAEQTILQKAAEILRKAGRS